MNSKNTEINTIKSRSYLDDAMNTISPAEPLPNQMSS